MSEFVSVLKSLLIMRMIEDESRTYERLIFAPSGGDMEVYRKGKHISMDHTPSALGMRRRAFDLMVATHSDIFRRMAIYDGRWHLPRLYVKELKEKQGFSTVSQPLPRVIRQTCKPLRLPYKFGIRRNLQHRGLSHIWLDRGSGAPEGSRTTKVTPFLGTRLHVFFGGRSSPCGPGIVTSSTGPAPCKTAFAALCPLAMAMGTPPMKRAEYAWYPAM